ncbi:MAG: bifunctional aspartate kinase/diaminopimelate decarboxylase [Pseudomonadota bacterium]
MSSGGEAQFDLSRVERGETRDSEWVVLKFGGSSVATIENWRHIEQRIRRRRDAGLGVLVVHSALRGVSDAIDESLALAASNDPAEADVVAGIEAKHHALAAEFGVDADEHVGAHLDTLRQLLAGVRLVRELTPRVTARAMALGELMATRLSSAWLSQQGIDVQWHDARELLRADHEPRERRAFLNASCEVAPDAEFAAQFNQARVHVTQGFIASNAEGETVLLGRGGSDTSAAYLATLLGAQRLEIWTDVPGMFSADPGVVPSARLLTRLHYGEAQEIASTGGLVLHPRCIGPLRAHDIPLFIRCTSRPELPGTLIARVTGEPELLVKAISLRQHVTLVSMEAVTMWHEVGFLARLFAVFAEHRVSIDLVSTSESNVTVSIDDNDVPLTSQELSALVDSLSALCEVTVIEDCAAVSLVGRKIRTILHKLGPALELFEEQRIHLLSQAANDLNLTVVVDNEQGYRLVQKLHPSIIRTVPGDDVIGETWESLQGGKVAEAPATRAWWQDRRDALISALGSREACYVYDAATIRAQMARLLSLAHVDRVFYAMKANPHPGILDLVYAAGLGFECVSPGELARVRERYPELPGDRMLYTPNFAPRDDYAAGFAAGAQVTLDNLYPLEAWPELFKGRDVFVRVDPGQGRGHHEHVRTAGVHSKFGVPLFELEKFRELVDTAGARVTGVHAHVGSGITDGDAWRSVGEALSTVAQLCPDVRAIDLGGGLGIAEKRGDPALDLDRLDASLAPVRDACPGVELWLEPGRFLVAEAGVLLARVTQTKGKGDVRYVGVATGMNSLIRPALYGAYHEIVNLTRLDTPASELVTVVGPICETGDKLGSDRLLPPSEGGDVLLIANAGAYAAAMASHYNLRDPAPELLLT